MNGLTFAPQVERAPTVAFDAARVRAPQYGRWLDDFVEGQVFEHPRGYTFERSEMRSFATAFHQANPVHLNVEAARAAGFRDVPATAQMVFNVVLSLGVQNNSEKAVANLGYYNARFLRPVYAGDTLRALSRVHSVRDRGDDKPGIVHVHTVGLNQREEVVLRYERKIMIRHRPDCAPQAPLMPASQAAFPWADGESVELGLDASNGPARVLTGAGTRFEHFAPGDVIVHPCGRTISDEHMGWTYRLGNTHPLHFDRLYSSAQSGPMSGDPIVYGGLVFAWLDGLASRDVSENALWELGFTEGYHTAPAVSGDTIYALSRVLSCETLPAQGGTAHGVLALQLVGVKNCTGHDALTRYGGDLFVKEGSKRGTDTPRAPEKVFEIERELLFRV